MNEESIFAVALEKQSAAERQAYLDEACGGNAELRAQVEGLLQASSDAGSFLNHAPLGSAEGTDATIAATRASGDTEKSAVWSGALPLLEPCDKPDRIGKLDNFEIIEVVGHGGMGAVLRAFDTKLSRVVAVKIMAPELAANPTAVKRFLREAQSAASVHHDHVVTIHNVEETHRPPYLVMQFIEGQTLAQKIERDGALELKQILRIGSQTAAGLAAAHKLGLVHRDVKPANILLENGVERVKITDFGLARAGDDVEITQTGMIAGTPQYMSPEQAKGETIDMRSDLFSLGSVLYSMCTGRAAFRADNTMAVLRRVCDDQPRPIQEVNPEIPEWLSAIVLKLLAKNPADRFQSAGEVAELLSQHLAHVQSPALVARPATVIVPPAVVEPPPLVQKFLPPAVMPPATPASSGAGVALVVVMCLSLLVLAPVCLIGVGLLVPWMSARSGPRNQAIVNVDPFPPDPTTIGAVTEPPAAEPVSFVDWGQFLDPVGNCRIERRVGMAIFHVPGTRPYNLMPPLPERMNAPRLLQEVSGDFVLRVRVLPFARSQPATAAAGRDTASWRSAGLVLMADDQSLVRLERVSWGEQKGGAPMMHLETYTNGVRGLDYYGQITDDERSTLFQLERRGNELICRYSDDGSRWDSQKIDGLTLPERVLVGLAAVHTTPTQFDPAFEDLRFQADADSLAASQEMPPVAGPWVSLFNMQDLTGWNPQPDAPGGWSMNDGILTGRGANQYLYSVRDDYEDFRLRAEVKINAHGDSGILVRMAPHTDPPAAESGYEVQLVGDPNHVSPTASIIRHGASVTGQGVMGRGDLIRPDTWFALEITAIGGKLTVAIDGREVVSMRDEPPQSSGHIALQSFSDQTEVAFRKIEIQELTPRDALPNNEKGPPPLAIWGAVCDGWQVGVGWKEVRPSYKPGEKIDFELKVRNTTDTELTIDYHRPENWDLWYSGDRELHVRIFGRETRQLKLTPHEESTVEVPQPQIATDWLPKNSYQVRFTTPLGDESQQPPAGVLGFDLDGPQIVTRDEPTEIHKAVYDNIAWGEPLLGFRLGVRPTAPEAGKERGLEFFLWNATDRSMGTNYLEHHALDWQLVMRDAEGKEYRSVPILTGPKVQTPASFGADAIMSLGVATLDRQWTTAGSPAKLPEGTYQASSHFDCQPDREGKLHLRLTSGATPIEIKPTE